MNTAARTSALLLLAVLLNAGCASTPETQTDPYNEADEQRSRAKQAQDELSSETSGK